MADFDARMAALRARFVAQAAAEADPIAAHAQAGQWDALGSICHRLAGRAGLFGFAAIGDMAREIDEAIEAGADGATLHRLACTLTDELARLPQAAA